jgi:carbon monoxide dehydrogenase subunit G
MELTNEFEVAVPLDEAWAVLTDVEKIAPCMPGAQLKEVEDDEYRGIVRVKVGPITASYKGAAKFLELDVEHRRAVLKAEGRETRGQGNASATITAVLVPSGDGTKVEVVTDLNVTGKVAQFGRGVLADVSVKLLDQFVQNLETTVLSRPEPAPGPEPAQSVTPPPEAAEAPPAPAASSGPRPIDHPEPEPVDLGAAAGWPVARRVLPFASIAGILVLIRIVVYALKRRRK